MSDQRTHTGDGFTSSTISLGRVAGVPIGLNWSWLVVFVLLVWSLAQSFFPLRYPFLSNGTYFVMAVIAAILFFASLLLHELGHAVQARREGMEIEGITLWLFGGVARFKRMFPSAGAEFRIAIAGPLVTLVLGAAFATVAAVVRTSQSVHGVVAWLGYVNLLLLVFNLVPALPLDGGRLLRSLLWDAKGSFGWATKLVGEISRGFGYLLIGGGVVLFFLRGSFTGVWFALVGWFLLGAADSEQRYVRAREALSGLRVGDVMVRNLRTADPDQTIVRFMDETFGTSRHSLYPVVHDGELVGLLPFSRIARISRDEWPQHAVGECMLPPDELPALSEDEELVDAFTELLESGRRRGVVVEGSRLVGLLSLSDVERLLSEPTHEPAGSPA